MTKCCERCGENKELAEFHGTMFSVDGRTQFCRTCCKGEMLSQEAWDMHRRQAIRRGIAFNLTYKEWFSWWHDALAQRGPGADRGKGPGQWMMCRFNDQGPYALDNVFCGTAKDNAYVRLPRHRAQPIC
jgi:hypothetical protein